MKTNDLLVTEIQHFCMHDGPGVRTVVFLKGCPLHCPWCHNPETNHPQPELLFSENRCVSCGGCEAVCPNHAQIVFPQRRLNRSLCTACGACAAACPVGALQKSGKRMTIEEILAEALQDSPFYGEQGGLTVSGGEPTFQPEGLCSLLFAAKKAGLSTCLETCGSFPPELAKKLLPVTDLFLFDYKDSRAERLFESTGLRLSAVLAALRALDDGGGKTVLRCLLIPEVNLKEDHGEAICELYHSLSHCACVELLPYHPYGNAKAEQLGRTDMPLYRKPEKEEILAFAETLKARGVPVKCFGSIISRF